MDDVPITLEDCRAKFHRLLNSPEFGELPARSKVESPTISELRRTHFLDVLKSDTFWKRMLGLSEECRRLEREQGKVLEVARRKRREIDRRRKAIKRLETQIKRLSEFGRLYRDVAGHEEVSSAITIITGLRDSLARVNRILTSNIHPALRRSGDKPFEWELLVKEYSYGLERLHIKAPRQSFWRSIDSAICSFARRHSIRTLSDTTRFHLIAAIYQATGHGHVKASTIKQSFHEHPLSGETS